MIWSSLHWVAAHIKRSITSFFTLACKCQGLFLNSSLAWRSLSTLTFFNVFSFNKNVYHCSTVLFLCCHLVSERFFWRCLAVKRWHTFGNPILNRRWLDIWTRHYPLSFQLLECLITLLWKCFAVEVGIIMKAVEVHFRLKRKQNTVKDPNTNTMSYPITHKITMPQSSVFKCPDPFSSPLLIQH